MMTSKSCRHCPPLAASSTRATQLTQPNESITNSYRSHRITKQIAPILSGDADITTMAHGVYVFVADMSFYNWTLPSLNVRNHNPRLGKIHTTNDAHLP